MWKVLLFVLLSMAPLAAIETVQPLPLDEAMEPTYAKWGRIAMEETKERYPEAAIIDYLHVGATKNAETTTETFKLWLRMNESKKEFGVYVAIRFATDTEEIIDITFTETDR